MSVRHLHQARGRVLSPGTKMDRWRARIVFHYRCFQADYVSELIATMPPTLVPELIITDLETSLAFYRDLLGFEIEYERAEERFVYLSREGAALMLEQPYVEARLWPKSELLHPFGRGVNFEIGVNNVDVLHTAVCNAGIAIFLPLEEMWYGREKDEIGVRQFAVQDPDGYLIRLSQDMGTRPVSRCALRRFEE